MVNPALRYKPVVHISIRPFMNGSGPQYEPNAYYRDWLEENVGIQNIDWNWDIYSVDADSLAIYFASLVHATLFELTWP